MSIQISLKEQVVAPKYVRDIPVGNVISLASSPNPYLVCHGGELISPPRMVRQAGGRLRSLRKRYLEEYIGRSARRY